MKAPTTSPTPRRKWWVLGAGAAACLASWIALAIGIAVGAGFTVMVVLATLAAVTTEGLVWLTAAVLGMKAFEARREIKRRFRNLVFPGQ